jgi:hypothetical protein
MMDYQADSYAITPPNRPNIVRSRTILSVLRKLGNDDDDDTITYYNSCSLIVPFKEKIFFNRFMKAAIMVLYS